MRDSISDNNTKGNHATESECPLGNRNGDETAFAETVLHCALERVSTRELAVDDDEANSPVHRNSEADEQQYAHGQASLSKCIRLANDT